MVTVGPIRVGVVDTMHELQGGKIREFPLAAMCALEATAA